VHHLDSWIKIDQLDVTFFLISLFTAQHVSNVSASIFRSLRHIVDLFHVLYCSGSMCVGVTVWFGWGGVVSLYRVKHKWCSPLCPGVVGVCCWWFMVRPCSVPLSCCVADCPFVRLNEMCNENRDFLNIEFAWWWPGHVARTLEIGSTMRRCEVVAVALRLLPPMCDTV